ncbi:MAG: arylsulfotransferase family protein [Solirubrobacteraceae bacterium]
MICVIVGTLAAALGPGALQARAEASDPGLHVMPFPGTPDASVTSSVIFSSLAPSELRSVRVSGSRSGAHPGHLTALPDGAGTAFVPDHPFDPREAVHVTAALRSRAAGTRSGDPGANTLGFVFTTAQATAHPAPHPPARRTRLAGDPFGGPTQSFFSRPDLHPPVVSATTDPDSTGGDLFLTPHDSPQNGAMILNSRGQLVWFQPVPGAAYNLAVQKYHDRQVLTYWTGKDTEPVGVDVILDHSYRTLAVVHAGNGYSADGHEFQITPGGTALLDAYSATYADLSSQGGPSNGRVTDCIIQIVDIRTGQVLWEWHALGHIPLTESYEKPPRGTKPYAYFHLNSIQELPDGNFLVSARNTWAVYEISRQTGNVIWTLGGKHSSFAMGPGTHFEWQHDARMQPGGMLSLFDDAGLPQEESQSSAMWLRLRTNPGSMTATLARRITHSPPLLAGALGNVQTLPGGNFLVGWGSQPEFSEYTSTGRQIFNASLPLGMNSYRAYRFAWRGRPATPPALANLPGPNGTVAVVASWNGATDVAGWRVLGGPNPYALTLMGKGRARGFETGIGFAGNPRVLAVEAMDSAGHVLGTSPAQLERPHLAVFGSEAFVSASSRWLSLPVGCFIRGSCRISTRIRSGGSVLARWTSQSLAAGSGAVLRFKLSPSSLLQVEEAAGHRLPVQISVQDGLISARLTVILTAYSVTGRPPPQSVSRSRALSLDDTHGFVSQTGTGGILAACFAAAPCRVRAVISHRGTVIATAPRQVLGERELAYVHFQLTAAGRSLLKHSPGNQQGAEIKLTGGGATVTGRIDLIRYG